MEAHTIFSLYLFALCFLSSWCRDKKISTNTIAGEVIEARIKAISLLLTPTVSEEWVERVWYNLDPKGDFRNFD